MQSNPIDGMILSLGHDDGARRSLRWRPRGSDKAEDSPMNNNNWNIDAAHTGINFSVRHMVVSKVRGRFGKYTGTITLDDARHYALVRGGEHRCLEHRHRRRRSRHASALAGL